MPNHAHDMIITNAPIGTRDRVSLQRFGNFVKNSLSIIINQCKGSVTRYGRKNWYKNFALQTLFYDHIIRNDNDLQWIRTYIQNNPIKWEQDEYCNE